jgi:hypothetical protein
MKAGKEQGGFLMWPHRLNIGVLVKSGENGLGIRVANLWSNNILATPPRPSVAPGPGYGLTDILYGPSERIPMPSGLPGPVVLVRQ